MSAEFVSREELEQIVEARTRELTTLLQISREVTSNLSLASVLEQILEKLATVVPFTNSTIVGLDGETFQTLAYRGNAVPAEVALKIRFSASNDLDQKVMASLQPLIIPDVYADTDDARDFRQQAGAALQGLYRETKTWMRVPLIFQGRVTGMLTLHYHEPHYYTSRHAHLALAFAEHAAIALENARLFEVAEKRTAEMRLLLEMTSSLVSTLELTPLLDLILLNLKQVVNYTGAAIAVLEGEEMVILDYNGPQARTTMLGVRISLTRESGYKEVLRRRAPVLIADMWADDPWLAKIRADNPDIMQGRFEYAHAWLGVPLSFKDELMGVLRLDHQEPAYFSQQHAQITLAFANQAAVAIKNARLYEQARQLAALEERQKLARELHDSVSQALYGISLGARTARTLLERDPSRARDPLEYISTLAEAGLAEMRALIFELRPESLQMEGLVAALTKQTDALRARHQMHVEPHFCPEPDVTLVVKETFYRIAQEALHNIVKHARAHRVELRLETDAATLRLSIRDDGLGFDPAGKFPGHLGLRSMRERAEKIGGVFRLDSVPGQGTFLQVDFSTPTLGQ